MHATRYRWAITNAKTTTQGKDPKTNKTPKYRTPGNGNLCETSETPSSTSIKGRPTRQKSIKHCKTGPEYQPKTPQKYLLEKYRGKRLKQCDGPSPTLSGRGSPLLLLTVPLSKTVPILGAKAGCCLQCSVLVLQYPQLRRFLGTCGCCSTRSPSAKSASAIFPGSAGRTSWQVYFFFAVVLPNPPFFHRKPNKCLRRSRPPKSWHIIKRIWFTTHLVKGPMEQKQINTRKTPTTKKNKQKHQGCTSNAKAMKRGQTCCSTKIVSRCFLAQIAGTHYPRTFCLALMPYGSCQSWLSLGQNSSTSGSFGD